jgi:hypothetical protein
MAVSQNGFENEVLPGLWGGLSLRRFDALVCTSTCRQRKRRGHDLGYLVNLPDYLAEVRRMIHDADLDAVATAKAVRAAKREGRAQRRGLPQVRSRIKAVAPGPR